ncbi:integrase [Gossypium australe]|uniref:Integrase n=1 Tax=Gossypium australe TaxID=47621 RepID=A0A5B6VWV9_9ROSI|nr:integrase [Gossypium australe]
MKFWRHYLFGEKCHVYSDHKNYHLGKTNVVANGLSRKSLLHYRCNTPNSDKTPRPYLHGMSTPSPSRLHVRVYESPEMSKERVSRMTQCINPAPDKSTC